MSTAIPVHLTFTFNSAAEAAEFLARVGVPAPAPAPATDDREFVHQSDIFPFPPTIGVLNGRAARWASRNQRLTLSQATGMVANVLMFTPKAERPAERTAAITALVMLLAPEEREDFRRTFAE